MEGEMMETVDKQKGIIEILNVISKLMAEEVTLIADDEQKLIPHWDMEAIISKFLALLVFAGLNVPTHCFSPPYNRVNADIEYWKKRFEGFGK